jgi:hypothetical protein
VGQHLVDNIADMLAAALGVAQNRRHRIGASGAYNVMYGWDNQYVLAMRQLDQRLVARAFASNDSRFTEPNESGSQAAI